MNILFDVGACKGDFSHAWLAKNPGGKVYCVEPDSENAKNLRIRFKGMNVEVIEKAVWVENEKRPFWSGTTPENASLTVKNEAQFDNFSITSKQVECVSLSTLIGNVTSDASASTTLKLDVEGVEFRCLKSMFDAEIFPARVYFEDGCRKCMDIDEWKARVSVYKLISDKNLDKNFFVEGNTKKQDDYLECYDPLSTHQPYRVVRDGEADISKVVSHLFEVAKGFIEENPGVAPFLKKIDFSFMWLTCHTFYIHLKDDDKRYHVTKDHPVNSNKDTDIAVRFIKDISFVFEESGICFPEVSYMTLEEYAEEMNEILCRQGRDSLL